MNEPQQPQLGDHGLVTETMGEKHTTQTRYTANQTHNTQPTNVLLPFYFAVINQYYCLLVQHVLIPAWDHNQGPPVKEYNDTNKTNNVSTCQTYKMCKRWDELQPLFCGRPPTVLLYPSTFKQQICCTQCSGTAGGDSLNSICSINSQL